MFELQLRASSIRNPKFAIRNSSMPNIESKEDQRCSNFNSALPQSAIRNSQSAIRNPQLFKLFRRSCVSRFGSCTATAP